MEDGGVPVDDIRDEELEKKASELIGYLQALPNSHSH
jgi:hypothetical protein